MTSPGDTSRVIATPEDAEQAIEAERRDREQGADDGE